MALSPYAGHDRLIVVDVAALAKITWLIVTSHEKRKPLYQSGHAHAPWPSAACKKMGPGGMY